MAASEQITEVSGRSDNIVRQLAFKTNQGKTFGPFGIAQGAAFSVTGKTIIGFFGRWGTSLDQLGFMRLNSLPTVRTAALGGAGGTVFDATPPPGAAKISRLSVHAGGQLNQIRLDWWDAGGGLVGSASFGG